MENLQAEILKMTKFNFNENYDLLIIENYPEYIYHYVLLKDKDDHLIYECNDCWYNRKNGQELTKQIRSGKHKGYPINFDIANKVGFNIDYLVEKLDINEAESYLLAKILTNHFGVKFKEL